MKFCQSFVLDERESVSEALTETQLPLSPMAFELGIYLQTSNSIGSTMHAGSARSFEGQNLIL